MAREEETIELARLLISRLERLSVDSRWARRSSGLRGTLLKSVEMMDAGDEVDLQRLDSDVKLGFWMLENAAREIQYS